MPSFQCRSIECLMYTVCCTYWLFTHTEVSRCRVSILVHRHLSSLLKAHAGWNNGANYTPCGGQTVFGELCGGDCVWGSFVGDCVETAVWGELWAAALWDCVGELCAWGDCWRAVWVELREELCWGKLCGVDCMCGEAVWGAAWGAVWGAVWGACTPVTRWSRHIHTIASSTPSTRGIPHYPLTNCPPSCPSPLSRPQQQ